MIPELSRLKDHEIELLYKAPVLVCILIAGADGTIDKKEIKEAIRFAEKKINRSSSAMEALYQEIFNDFEDKLRVVLQSYPYESTQRNPLLIGELAEISQLWPRMDKVFAAEFLRTLKDIATSVAESSGGLLGYKSVGSEEAKWVNLPMIQEP